MQKDMCQSDINYADVMLLKCLFERANKLQNKPKEQNKLTKSLEENVAKRNSSLNTSFF